MKKITLITTMVLMFIMGLYAQDEVTFEIVTDPLTEGDLPMTGSGQLAWGDYNNDGHLDFLIASGQGNPYVGLFKNNGDGTFTEVLTDVTMYALATAAFFDYNNDGALDLIVGGSVDGTSEAVLTELYMNSGAPNYEFILNEDEVFIGVSAESGGDNSTRMVEPVDVDNDGWTDILLSGNAGGEVEEFGSSRIVALYKNNGGTFELQLTPVDGSGNFQTMNGGGIHCGDLNNDGYADMIVSGYVDPDIQTVTDLYINKGDGTFSYFEDSRSTFTGHVQGETFFADVNNDGFMDIVEVGRDVNSGWSHFANIYLNDGDLNFTTVDASKNGLIGGQATIASGDINNDGLVDMVFAGWGPNTTFFYNNGDTTFTAVAIDPDQARARGGCVTLADFSNDGNLDFSIFGYRDGGDGTAENPTWPDYLLVNKLAEGVNNNTAPAAPANFTVTASNGGVLLEWDAATDDTTPSQALRYNVYAKKNNESDEYVYFPVDITTGWLKAAGERPFISGTSITLNGFNTDQYEFGVQAIDNAKLGGEFAVVKSTSIQSKMTQLADVRVYSAFKIIHILNNSDKDLDFKVYSVSGQLLKSGTCEPHESMEIKTPQKNFYVVKVSDGTNILTKKVITF